MEKPSSLPHKLSGEAVEEPLARVVCDYIVEWTDPFIYEQYERFCTS
jgi:dGTP triphosphohydrolase